MAKEIISPRTRGLFRDYFVGTTLSNIKEKFDAARICANPEYLPQLSVERRQLVERYYQTLDFTRWADVQKLLDVFGSALADAE